MLRSPSRSAAALALTLSLPLVGCTSLTEPNALEIVKEQPRAAAPPAPKGDGNGPALAPRAPTDGAKAQLPGGALPTPAPRPAAAKAMDGGGCGDH
jgi:hypothetical protein